MAGLQEGEDRWVWSPNKLGKDVSSAAREWWILKQWWPNNKSSHCSLFAVQHLCLGHFFQRPQMMKGQSKNLESSLFSDGVLSCGARCSCLFIIYKVDTKGGTEFHSANLMAVNTRHHTERPSWYKVKTDCTSTGWPLHLEATKGFWLHDSVHSNKQALSCDYMSTCWYRFNWCDHTPRLRCAGNLTSSPHGDIYNAVIYTI